MNFDKKSKIIIFTAFAVVIFFYGLFMSLGRLCSKYLTTQDIETFLNKSSELVFNVQNMRIRSTKDLCFEIYFEHLIILTPKKEKENLYII